MNQRPSVVADPPTPHRSDLSLPTFVSAMITWTPTINGELNIPSIKDTPGDLIIQDTPSYSVRIHNTEPSHAECILEVRIAATAQMTTEFNYHLE